MDSVTLKIMLASIKLHVFAVFLEGTQGPCEGMVAHSAALGPRQVVLAFSSVF